MKPKNTIKTIHKKQLLTALLAALLITSSLGFILFTTLPVGAYQPNTCLETVITSGNDDANIIKNLDLRPENITSIIENYNNIMTTAPIIFNLQQANPSDISHWEFSPCMQELTIQFQYVGSEAGYKNTLGYYNITGTQPVLKHTDINNDQTNIGQLSDSIILTDQHQGFGLGIHTAPNKQSEPKTDYYTNPTLNQPEGPTYPQPDHALIFQLGINSNNLPSYLICFEDYNRTDQNWGKDYDDLLVIMHIVDCTCEDTPTQPEYEDECAATVVIEYNKGLIKGTEKPERYHPEKATGLPEDTDNKNAPINFVSLGFGGTITLFFENPIGNTPNEPDFRIVETSFDDPNCNQYPEKINVSISQYNDNDWYDLGELCLDNKGQGYFYLEDAGPNGLEWAQYLKIEDKSNPNDFSTHADGYDLDGVGVFNCLEEIPCDDSINLIKNGDFESPIVPENKDWDYFPDTELSNWTILWRDTLQPGNLELQTSYLGWTQLPGSTQYAELDAHGRPGSSQASVIISQTIQTVPGRQYNLSFSFSPRPNTPITDNILNATILNQTGIILETNEYRRPGSSNTDWTHHTIIFTATSSVTTIQFTDKGQANQKGTFLDNVSMHAICGPTHDQPTDPDCGCDCYDGCSQGYWKQEHHYDDWTTYNPTTLLQNVFSISETTYPDLYDLTFIELLHRPVGGDKAVQLLKQAIAGLLNAEHPDINYKYTSLNIINMVNILLLNGDESAMQEWKDNYEEINNCGSIVCSDDDQPTDPELCCVTENTKDDSTSYQKAIDHLLDDKQNNKIFTNPTDQDLIDFLNNENNFYTENQIQEWLICHDYDYLNLHYEFLGKEAAYTNIFGYWLNQTQNQDSIFHPLFRTGNLVNTPLEFTKGDTGFRQINITTPDLQTISFGIHSHSTNNQRYFSTINNSNPDDQDHVLIYTLSETQTYKKYLLCHEDLLINPTNIQAGIDYDDLLVILNLSCSNQERPLDTDNDQDGYTENEGDCNDNNPTIWRTIQVYEDNDNDGFGIGDPIELCIGESIPEGYADKNNDCDDTDASVNPEASELCDGIDNDCDDEIDEGFQDTDGDGLADCVDADDDDDGVEDELDCDPTDPTTWQTVVVYVDADVDGYGVGDSIELCIGESIPEGYADNNDDCDDNDPNINPGLENCDSIEDPPIISGLSPVLECVEWVDETTYIAHFGYNNQKEIPITVAIGENNKFNRENQDHGQPTTFEPGRHYNVFNVEFDGTNLVWTLAGKTSTASNNPVQRCEDTDEDNIIDIEDNCPDTPNPDQKDENNNGIGDACEEKNDPLNEDDKEDDQTPITPTRSTTSTYTSSSSGKKNQDPIAIISEPHHFIVDDLPLTLKATESHDPDPDDTITTYEWKLGDGSYVYGETIEYNPSVGNHFVSLTVYDNHGNDDQTFTTLTVEQPNRPPQQPTIKGIFTIPSQQTYSFSAQSTDPDGDDIKYLFDWGDDTSEESEFLSLPKGSAFNLLHAWDESGEYTLTVTVTDGELSSSASVTVQLLPALINPLIIYSILAMIFVISFILIFFLLKRFNPKPTQ